MKIIKFDLPTPVEAAPGAHKMFLDETIFVCPHCEKKGTANFKGMVFRVLEFYCLHCGVFFKMTNPAFISSPKQK